MSKKDYKKQNNSRTAKKAKPKQKKKNNNLFNELNHLKRCFLDKEREYGKGCTQLCFPTVVAKRRVGHFTRFTVRDEKRGVGSEGAPKGAQRFRKQGKTK